METVLMPSNPALQYNQPNFSPVQMTFMDHLEALRWHLVRSFIVLILAAIGVFIFVDSIFDNIVFAPARADFITYISLCRFGHTLNLGDSLCMPPINMSLLGNTINGTFMSAITISFTCGILIAFPYILWELWKFIKPALSAKEARSLRGSIGWISFYFITGATFGYFLLAPFTFNFLGNFTLGTMGSITYLPTINDYIDTLSSIVIGCGLAFELPVVTYILSSIGIVTPGLLKKYRKYAYLVILILAAVITPSPDWTSQAIVTVPLVILFEISILISKRVERKRNLA